MLAALIQAKERGDPQGWLAFQTELSGLKLQRTRMEREAADMQVGCPCVGPPGGSKLADAGWQWCCAGPV